MGNSRGRRKFRRLAGERSSSKRQPPAATISQQSTPSNLPFWKRIPGWIYGAILISSVLITLLEGYPWLSIQEGSLLDPQNPYSELFSIANGGYAPVSDLSADCIIDLKAGNIVIGNSGARFDHFAHYLVHGGNTTIPCFRTIVIDGRPLSSADLTIRITYSFYPLTYRLLRRQQTFKFRAVKASDGSLRWTFLS
jgi:hypothetical protein